MKKYLIVSTILHMILFLSVGHTENGKASSPSGDGEGTAGATTTFTGPMSVDIVENPSKGQGEGSKGSDCTTQYGGIGVEFNPTGLLIAVAPEGPADKAGLAAGDLLVFQVGIDYAGEPGTSVLVSYYKADNLGKMVQKTLIRDIICYKN